MRGWICRCSLRGADRLGSLLEEKRLLDLVLSNTQDRVQNAAVKELFSKSSHDVLACFHP